MSEDLCATGQAEGGARPAFSSNALRQPLACASDLGSTPTEELSSQSPLDPCQEVTSTCTMVHAVEQGVVPVSSVLCDHIDPGMLRRLAVRRCSEQSLGVFRSRVSRPTWHHYKSPWWSVRRL